MCPVGILGLISTAFVVGLSGAMGPGSLLVVVVTDTVKRGFWAGPAAIVGHAAAEIAVVALLRLGLGKVLAYEKVLGAVGLIGGAMLFYFGYGTVKTARNATLSLERAAESARTSGTGSGKGLLSTAIAGIAASISNPYWILWWATVGAAHVATSTSYGAFGPAAFFAGHIAADFAWYSFVSLAIATGTRFFNDKAYRGILFACGIFLFLFGAYFLKLGMESFL